MKNDTHFTTDDSAVRLDDVLLVVWVGGDKPYRVFVRDVPSGVEVTLSKTAGDQLLARLGRRRG